jgi:hypothetical protein
VVAVKARKGSYAGSCQRQCRKRSIIFRRNPAWEIQHSGVCVWCVPAPVSLKLPCGARRRPGRPIAPQRALRSSRVTPGLRAVAAESRSAASRRDWRVRLCGVRPRRLLTALGPKSGLAAAFGVLEAALRLPRRLRAAQSMPRLTLVSSRSASQHYRAACRSPCVS